MSEESAMHTKDFLAEELRKAGLNAMADKAATGYYHDYLSPLDTPCVQLAQDLQTYAKAPSWPRKDEAEALLQRHLDGEFDASREESDAWAASEDGQETFSRLGVDRTDRPKPAKEMPPIGRLAMREEGRFWNAYYALPGTMDGALLLGSIQRKFVEDAARQQAFMNLMRDCVSDIIEAETGHRPVWPAGPQPAPEPERSGHA